MRKLAIYVSGKQDCAGVSLRGGCADSAEAVYLQQALEQIIQQFRQRDLPCLWLDCRHLETLSWQGQRALLHVDNLARTAGICLFWCGLNALVGEQLRTSGLYSLLYVRTAKEYAGPLLLLEENLPATVQLVRRGENR
ncbi:STAS domain-containing protein [Hymenobacter mucosus]|uniref:Anti-anti-sigma regulatory factor (Antagonist of anti-sigma factor) n=2 Tax=Hymenobacter TaxID=89966 RepID=A0A239AZU9_9BACT|nr:hypothetical protein [Hymenobacter mucosus]SNS01246.1 Anti-anti-sigma regulatory factor (antagonist of anti-sigma factor) [Hymenobacter mucosus]